MRLLPVIVIALLPLPALAHGGSLAAGWTLDPWVTAPIAACALLYAAGLRRLWSRSRGGRSTLVRHALLFGAGLMALTGALVSPIHEAGGRSFTLHMVEHEVIMLVASPLLALSRPLTVLLWALPGQTRAALADLSRRSWFARGWRFLGDPVTATVIQAAVMWGWHAPGPFGLALRHEGWHVAQHLSFLVSALLFWWAMVRTGPRSYGVAALCLFATSLAGGALGALMALSSSPWYPEYAALGMTPYGLSPVEDQQLAGLLMWIPGGLVHAGAAVFVLRRFLALDGGAHAAGLE